jgi:hypothetical protein
LQEVIEGEDYCLTAICDHGKIKASMAYNNLYQFPRDTGAGIMRETIDDQPFLDTSQILLKALKWHGIAQIDFRWSGKKKDPAYLIESNPRFWAGLYHSVKSGVDYPWLLYQLTAFKKITDIQEVEIGTKTKIPGLWALSAVHEIVEDGTHFERLKETWEEIWSQNNDENWQNRFKKFSNSIKESISVDDIKKSYNLIKAKTNDAISEFEMDDDPMASLGVLFIFSSLIRHGELPPEVE